jgi:hypothetical protein
MLTMTFRASVGLAVMWILSLFVVATWAQSRTGQQPGLGDDPATVVLSVISGEDIGFRVESWNGNVPEGRWVVRSPLSNGRWVEPVAAPAVRPIR